MEVSGVLWNEFELWSAAGMVWKLALLSVGKAREQLDTHVKDSRRGYHSHN